MGSVLSKSSNSEEIKLPVFAIKTGERTVMGMITEGDALSSIEVFAKGSKTAQSTVHPVMTYRGTFTRTLFDASWEKKKTIIVAENAAEIPAFTVRYTLFGEGGYNEVAERTAAWYRQQTDGQTARAADAALTLQVLGAVRKPGSVLGVPVQAVYAATTYTQTASLVRRLREEGTPGLHVVYQGMFAGGLYDKMPVKAKTESALGSRKELAALCELLAEDGSWLFPAADLSGIYTSGYGVSYKGRCQRFRGRGQGDRPLFASDLCAAGGRSLLHASDAPPYDGGIRVLYGGAEYAGAARVCRQRRRAAALR